MQLHVRYVYTRLIFAVVLLPTIKIFNRNLGPNLYIFVVKVPPWFHRHFTEILWHITAISPWKNTDRGDFVLKTAVRTGTENNHPWYLDIFNWCPLTDILPHYKSMMFIYLLGATIYNLLFHFFSGVQDRKLEDHVTCSSSKERKSWYLLKS